MGCILYADLVDERGVVECSATLDYILVTRFKESHKIKNYFTALKKGLDFKEKLIQKLPKK
jgi:hypothetical protein